MSEEIRTKLVEEMVRNHRRDVRTAEAMGGTYGMSLEEHLGGLSEAEIAYGLGLGTEDDTPGEDTIIVFTGPGAKPSEPPAPGEILVFTGPGVDPAGTPPPEEDEIIVFTTA